MQNIISIQKKSKQLDETIFPKKTPPKAKAEDFDSMFA